MQFHIGYYVGDKRDINKKFKEIVISKINSENNYQECELLENTDIVNPTIEIADVFKSSEIGKLNYFYLPKYSRYYFITQIQESLGNNLIISGKCDVLKSRAMEIKNKQTYIVRNEYDNNPYYQDEELPIRTDKQFIKLNVGTVGNAGHIYITVNNGKKIESGE